jgi:hypothetical protein
MYGWMRLVIVLARLGTSPELLIGHPLRVVSKLLILTQLGDDAKQIDGWIVLGGLRSWVTQEPLVVQLLHVLHGLLRGYPQLPRNELLCLHRIQWKRPVLLLLLLVYFEHAGRPSFLYLFKEDQGGEFVEQAIPLPDKISGDGLLGIELVWGGTLQLDVPEGLGHEV